MNTRHFNAEELFNSLPEQKRKEIKSELSHARKLRELERESRLAKACALEHKVEKELEIVEHKIAENDQWFISAEQEIIIEKGLLKHHTSIAEKLYFQKKRIIDTSLLPAKYYTSGVVAEIKSDMEKEDMLQQEDFEKLLEAIYKKQELIRAEDIINKERKKIEKHRKMQKEKEEIEKRKENLKIEKRRVERRNNILLRTQEKKIPYLVHFTPTDNLQSIEKYGLCSREMLDHNSLKYTYTDDSRYDGWLNWVSLSISFPNYQMFYKKRNSLENVDSWAVILINQKVLWELDCKYLPTNASKSEVMNAANDYSSFEGFENMFGNPQKRHDIPDFYTTDPQAEVMVHGTIPKHYFKTIGVEYINKQPVSNQINLCVEVLPELFGPRADYKYWQNANTNETDISL